MLHHSNLFQRRLLHHDPKRAQNEQKHGQVAQAHASELRAEVERVADASQAGRHSVEEVCYFFADGGLHGVEDLSHLGW